MAILLMEVMIEFNFFCALLFISSRERFDIAWQLHLIIHNPKK
jgi:hypothetical protein